MKDVGLVLSLLVTSNTSLSTADTPAGTVPELPPLLSVPPPPPPPLLLPPAAIVEIASELALIPALAAVDMAAIFVLAAVETVAIPI